MGFPQGSLCCIDRSEAFVVFDFMAATMAISDMLAFTFGETARARKP